MTAVASLDRVGKRFGAFEALKDVSIDLQAGEVLALLGENGAGKSTAMKLLYGVHAPDVGAIRIGGHPAVFRSPRDAMAAGIGMVFQQFSLIAAMTVRDNLLTSWPRTPFLIGRGRAAADRVLDRLRELAPTIDPMATVGDLGVGERQLVEICKVLNLDARVVILDEPTSVLAPTETARLHGFVRSLAGQGIAVVLITHKLADVAACADRVVVMRAGSVVHETRVADRQTVPLVEAMMGQRKPEGRRAPPKSQRPVPRLQIMNLSAGPAGAGVEAVTLEVGGGEIVGVAALAGNGQSQLAEAIAGVETITGGDVLLDGVSIARRSPSETRSLSIGYIPEDPRRNGVVETLDLETNLNLRSLTGRPEPLGNGPAAALEAFDVRPRDLAKPAGTLSGGNLQKLVAARELTRGEAAVLAVYPTMGLDLASTARIYDALFARAAAGAAVLWISEDLDDLLASAHRIAVLREGRLVAILDNGPELDRATIGALMTGGSRAAAA